MRSSPNPSPDSAIILAGGAGTRLGALTANTPKPLLPVAGHPFIRHLLDYLAVQEIRRVVLATGYMAAQFESVLGGHYRGLALSYSVETEPLGTGGALARAMNAMTDEAIFVLNGDTFFPVSLAALAARNAQLGTAGTMALRHVTDTGRYGRVAIGEDRIRTLDEKSTAGPGLVNGGVYLIRTSPLLLSAPRPSFSLEHDIFPNWAAEGMLGYVACDEYFVDIGVPADLERAQHEIGRQTSVSRENSRHGR
ncbi:MAG TPA: nucleotidyltransferase family protein [Candidatus Didemnitutus sp.]|jgi:D-glycero-alpha-D-manno-heptose 1-phosphate guanylyltransferase